MSKQLPIEVQNHEKKQGFFYDSMGEVSDGYHSFNELYEHRTALFAALSLMLRHLSWKSKLHADDTMYDGYFIAGIDLAAGRVIYHMPLSDWPLFEHIDELAKAPEWDEATPADTVKRLHVFTIGQELERKIKDAN